MRFADGLLNNKTIIMLYLAEYHLILATSGYDPRCYSAGFPKIIIEYVTPDSEWNKNWAGLLLVK